MSERTIICLVGSFGSGCSYIAENFIMPEGYKYISLSDVLRAYYKIENDGKECNLKRNEMQAYGNDVRKKKGNDFLAKLAVEEIEKTEDSKWIIDSIRNPSELKKIKSNYGKVFTFGIFADKEKRWKRVEEKYDRDRRLFDEDDKRDSEEKESYGQKVSDCFYLADIIVANGTECYKGNEDYELLKKNVLRYINIIKGEKKFEPTEDESIMAIAYANSIRSSCAQRKVGAVIVDSKGSIFSSGYNEVPKGSKSDSGDIPVEERPCVKAYGKCYRAFLREDFKNDLGKIILDEVILEGVYGKFKSYFKILDYCRALHAEENAILNVARNGSSSVLKEAKLFTTTFPCNLCANKIVQVGIKNVVYLEPYPQEEAKKTLYGGGVRLTPFQGVTSNGYFKLMEV